MAAFSREFVTSPCRGHDGGPLVESCLRILSLTVEPCFLDCLLGGAVGRATSYLSRWSSLLAHPFLPYLFSISEERRWPAVLSEGRRENAPRGRDYEDISPFFTPPPLHWISLFIQGWLKTLKAFGLPPLCEVLKLSLYIIRNNCSPDNGG